MVNRRAIVAALAMGLTGTAWVCGDTLAAAAPAVAESPSTISATGQAGVERLPELLRAEFDLAGEGKDAKAALAQLKERERAAREKLKALGSEGSAVTVHEPHSGASQDNDPQAQMQRMIRAQMRNGAAPEKPAGSPVRLAAKVVAEWPLAAKEVEAALVEGLDLQMKIEAAKLLDSGPQAALSAAEQERLEEMRLVAEEQGDALAGVRFTYVSKLSPEEQAKLLAEGFAGAHRQAETLARAAGMQVGGVTQLQASPVDRSSADNPYAMFYAMNQGKKPELAPTAEATSDQPGKVKYAVIVSASFQLLPAKE